MKKLILTLALTNLVSVCARAAAITLNLSAGQLSTPNGQPIPDGALVQVLVSTVDTTFSAPTGLSFVGSSVDDVVVASFAMNSASGGAPGVFSRAVQLEYNNLFGGRTIAAGMPMLLRWWPTLTTSATAPGATNVMGQFRRDAAGDFSDIGWTLPSAPSTRTLNVLTPAFGGSTPTSALSAVPEPSAALLSAMGLIGLFARRRRN